MPIELVIEAVCNETDTIANVFKQAGDLADKIDCGVSFHYNKIHCLATPNGNVEYGVMQYEEAAKSKTFKVATNNKNIKT